MKPTLTNCCLLLFSCTFTSCTHAYYLNAFNANNNTYHAIPLKSDAVKTSTYVGGNIATGGANSYWRDGVTSTQFTIHRSHAFGHFNAFYGSSFSLGSYHVKRYHAVVPKMQIDSSAINAMAGKKFFGGYGLDGGINFVLPLSNGSEWRVLGIETCYRNEFGDYLKFRKQLPDSAANIIDNNRSVMWLGIASDIIIKIKNSKLGYKVALGGSVLQNAHKVTGNEKQNGYGYFSQTFSFTNNKWTVFSAINFGTYAFMFQSGINYQLGSKALQRNN